jgi:hypothetical protein
MFEVLGLIIIVICIGVIAFTGGIKTFWYYYNIGDIKWTKKKKRK